MKLNIFSKVQCSVKSSYPPRFAKIFGVQGSTAYERRSYRRKLREQSLFFSFRQQDAERAVLAIPYPCMTFPQVYQGCWYLLNKEESDRAEKCAPGIETPGLPCADISFFEAEESVRAEKCAPGTETPGPLIADISRLDYQVNRSSPQLLRKLSPFSSILRAAIPHASDLPLGHLVPSVGLLMELHPGPAFGRPDPISPSREPNCRNRTEFLFLPVFWAVVMQSFPDYRTPLLLPRAKTRRLRVAAPHALDLPLGQLVPAVGLSMEASLPHVKASCRKPRSKSGPLVFFGPVLPPKPKNLTSPIVVSTLPKRVKFKDLKYSATDICLASCSPAIMLMAHGNCVEQTLAYIPSYFYYLCQGISPSHLFLDLRSPSNELVLCDDGPKIHHRSVQITLMAALWDVIVANGEVAGNISMRLPGSVVSWCRTIYSRFMFTDELLAPETWAVQASSYLGISNTQFVMAWHPELPIPAHLRGFDGPTSLLEHVLKKKKKLSLVFPRNLGAIYTSPMASHVLEFRPPD